MKGLRLVAQLASCDVCGSHEPDVRVTHVNIQTRGITVEVDLCDGCHAPVDKLMKVGQAQVEPGSFADLELQAQGLHRPRTTRRAAKKAPPRR